MNVDHPLFERELPMRDQRKIEKIIDQPRLHLDVPSDEGEI